MLALVLRIAVTAALAVAFVAALRASGMSVGYPVFVAGGALLCSLATMGSAIATRTRRADSVGNEDEVSLPLGLLPTRRISWRIAGFAVVWIGYVLALPVFGFIVTSIIALIVSLWITSGRIGVATILGPAVFVAVLAVLVSVVLYVPVPKSRLDHMLDEALFSLAGS